MSPHVLPALVLILVFAIALARPVSIGIVALVAAFVVGTVFAGESAEEIAAGFPGGLFVTLVGVTYLFAIARANGCVDWLVHNTVRLVRGRPAAVPWVFFALAAVLTSIGAVSPATVAVLFPIAMNLAAVYRISPLLIGLVTNLGATAGSFSPLGIFGIIVNGVMDAEEMGAAPLALYAATFLGATVVALVTVLLLGRRRPPGADARAEAGRDGDPPVAVSARPIVLDAERVTTLSGVVVLVVGSLVFGLDIGFLAVTVAGALAVLFPAAAKGAVDQVSWGVVLLVGGLVTYVELLERTGTISWLGTGVTAIGSPLPAALLICLIGAVVSAFASTTGMLSALIPLAVPLISTGQVGALGLMIALSLSSSLVDVSPFSTNGALALANAPEGERDRVYRGLLLFGTVMIVAAPLLSWLVFVVPGGV
ncbi:SLC13 family permease [Marinactinospora thermotolerans]|uniref:Transporter, UIT1 family n=1 Tax=Marinactinospora thermotolerans DSM 45154 TaxID=1122192 RepID=A0A1T4T9T4_9ACTN|nr:SLC13 family permease [Marinactinospora thermotolerans]SKA36918.1 transporter, UIT1 family [Marinactinospora thermotolerans DSM 45154]